MSAQLEIVKGLAAKAQAAQVWELRPILLALLAAVIEWMEGQERRTICSGGPSICKFRECGDHDG